MSNIEVIIEKHIGSKDIYKVPMHKSKSNKYIETTVPPEKRSLDNVPKYSDGSSKVRFQDWLEIKKSPELWPKLRNVSWGWGCDGKCYGWSHNQYNRNRYWDEVKRERYEKGRDVKPLGAD